MASALLPAEETRRLLDLARRDPAAAAAAMAKLSPEAQVALVCDAPLSRRGAVLGILPEPEAVIPLIPEAELCFTVKAVGLADAAWILEHATTEQIAASVDLDAWIGYEPDLATFGDWIGALARSNSETLIRGALALDPEMLVLWLKSRVIVEQKPASNESWQPPEGGQTLEGQFYFTPIGDSDDVTEVVALLRALFQEEYWTYFRLLQGTIWELDSGSTEWALRWRSGRLQDLGFPPWEEAMGIYRFIAPKQRATLPDEAKALDVEAWRLPVWLPQLPTVADGHLRLFQAIARLGDEERGASFFAFVAVANKVAVADRLPLGDAESTPMAIEKTARFASAGLEYVAAESGLDDTEILRRLPMERLFSIGANLDPASARP